MVQEFAAREPKTQDIETCSCRTMLLLHFSKFPNAINFVNGQEHGSSLDAQSQELSKFSTRLSQTCHFAFMLF